ncbi:hypothetical protein JCGZ_06173 [Jatropha curcas]|uniref:Uncharacterized protein n=1 Tax=Jatropha curcas TaxID=180498 RepID=A0A067KLU2_JATCU|nr:probable disease resistance protein At5g63020 [Jatropha curcas]KDP37117.1 hypothetical protein JCGZ_06173 [Jatropha curcas]
MGNCFSIQISCDSLITRCWDCSAGHVIYICQLEDNLEALQVATQELKAQKNDVMQRVNSEEDHQMKRLEQVQVWLSLVETTITEVDQLIRDGPHETERLCLGGCCTNNCKSSYIFGKMVAKRKDDVLALKGKGIFDKVVERVCVESVHVKKLEENLESLKSAREDLWGLKDDVMGRVKIEERQQKKPLKRVQLWLSRVEAATIEADALLIEGPKEITELHIQGSSDHKFGGKVAKTLKDLMALKENGDFKIVAEKAIVESVVERPIEPTVGLDAMFDTVWGCLMEEQVGILGLYGMGGVGKTTLLTQINNRFLNIVNDFDFVIWVVVSKDLRLAKVQEEIGKRIGISVKDWKSKSIDERAMEIFNILRKKKFILLLDDVWERVNLAKAGVPLPNKQNGSKIILTTRSEVVCSQMDALRRIKVEPLAWEKAWELFKEKVGEETLTMDPAILPLAKDVARECAGLPLALITIARAMACNKTPEEWRCALIDLRRSASDLQGMTDEVFPLLKYSYDKLPNNKVRSCFLYCALFPEDFQINKDDLIDYWICEKFWDDEENEDVARDRGYHIIGTLVYACLLEEEGKYVKMHDVIRDMALWIACKREKSTHNFLVRVGAQLTEAPKVRFWNGVKRISLMENSIQNLSEAPTSPDLLTLLLCRNFHLRDITSNFFQFMDALTILDLSNSSIQELPSGIARLPSLNYLNLGRTSIRKLPCELKMLKKLKYLNLEHNVFLDMIPRQVISSLSSLQVLKMIHCGFFYEVTEDNILSDSDMHVEELHCLKHLNVLSITMRSASALESYLNTHELLSSTQALSLECFSWSKSNFSWIANMKNLETLNISAIEHLKEMNVDSIMEGTEIQASRVMSNPMFVRERYFDSLREVNVEYCSRLWDLRWLILAPNLTVLKVACCEKVEEIISVGKLGGVSDTGENGEPFARLQVLILEDLPQLQSIYGMTLSFPLLEKMRILDCPILKKLPLNSGSANGRKVMIEAEEHWWRDLEWEDEDTKAVFQPCLRRCFSNKRTYCPPYFFDFW